MSTSTATPGFVDVLRVRTFRVLFGAELQSIFGDQLARVALSILVFSETGSAAATALTYGLTYLPAVAGGFLFARIGDRFPRRAVMIACDVLRAVTFAVMSIKSMPLVVIAVLLVVAVSVGPVFSASVVSHLAQQLSAAQFRTASALRMMTNQLVQVVGFAVGGVLVAAIGPRSTLAVNALTYAASLAAVAVLLRGASTPAARQQPQAESVVTSEPLRSASGFAVLRAVLRQVRVRRMLTVSMLAGLFVVPEGLAVPFAHQFSGSTTEVGLLLAALPFGSAFGIVFVMRVVRPAHRYRVALVMAVATGVPLVLTALATNVLTAGVLWAISGFASAYQVEVFVSLVAAVPDEIRARLLSVFGSLLLGSQGIGPLVFGVIASLYSPSSAVALAGGAGSAVAALVLSGDLVTRRSGRHRGRPGQSAALG